MQKRHAPWALIAILIFGWAAGHVFGLVLAVAGLGIVYVSSLRLHPRARHTGWRGCGGSGEHHSALFPWTHRRCGGCDGGRKIRWGARRWGPQHIRGEHTDKAAARQAARENRSWR